MLHQDNRAVSAKQKVKNYEYKSKGLLDYASFCQLFGSTLFIRPYFCKFYPTYNNINIQIQIMFILLLIIFQIFGLIVDLTHSYVLVMLYKMCLKQVVNL